MAPTIETTPHRLIVIASVFLVAFLNTPFWRDLFIAVDPSSVYEWLFSAAVFVVLIAGYALALTLFSLPYILKPVIAAFIIATAVIHYFAVEYGTVIDASMIRNVLETNQAEATDLVTARLLLFVAVAGLLPTLLIWRTRLAWPPFSSLVLSNLKFAGITSVIGIGAVAGFFMDFTSVTREYRALLLKLAPANAVSAVIRVARSESKSKPATLSVFGADARKGASWLKRNRPVITVLVLGETARADHFSLNGYARNTNPRLATLPDIITFRQVTSCGTDTAQSVPCIFSGMGRSKFSRDQAFTQEGLLDIVQRAGLSVLWRENQSGCKGVCDRVPSEILTTARLDAYCRDGECHDEILLHDLRAKMEAMRNGGLIVLHMMGSHGPAYYKRVPSGFRPFQPTCDESQFSRCTTEQLVNSFDTTIAYTDLVLAKLVDLLAEAANADVDTAMLYVSDHGESLGEKGLYLHGMPFAIAPKEQTHVPMMAWVSPSYADSYRLSTDCLASFANAPLSHDNVFHTILGLLDIDTKVYDANFDLLASCHTKTADVQFDQSKRIEPK
ncbi:MAG: phosphoethanolamine transferase [Hyphomicrobium sp.]